MFLPFDAHFDVLISFSAAYILHVFGWRCVLIKRCREIRGLRKKENTWSLFLEFRCSSNLKINEKRHDFRLCLPFPLRPLTHTRALTHIRRFTSRLPLGYLKTLVTAGTLHSWGWGRQETRHKKHFKTHLTMWSSMYNMSWGLVK